MGRLIDAEKLILHLKDYALQESPSENESAEERRTSEMVLSVILNCIEAVAEQPTAYDVEKVVEQLRCDTNCPNCSEHCADAFVCGAEDVTKQAIEIVRKGGAE